MPTGILKGPATPRVGRPPVTISTSVTLSTHAQESRPSFFRMSRAPLQGCRQKTLKCINCRPFLMAICALVVIECACVLAELMVDLQGIKYRFENEQKEINRLVSHLKEKFPHAFFIEDMKTMNDVITLLEKSIVLRKSEDLLPPPVVCPCVCPCNVTSGETNSTLAAISSRGNSGQTQSTRAAVLDSGADINLLSVSNRNSVKHSLNNFSTPMSFLASSITSSSKAISSSVSEKPLNPLSPVLSSSLGPKSNLLSQPPSSSLSSTSSNTAGLNSDLGVTKNSRKRRRSIFRDLSQYRQVRGFTTTGFPDVRVAEFYTGYNNSRGSNPAQMSFVSKLSLLRAQTTKQSSIISKLLSGLETLTTKPGHSLLSSTRRTKDTTTGPATDLRLNSHPFGRRLLNVDLSTSVLTSDSVTTVKTNSKGDSEKVSTPKTYTSHSSHSHLATTEGLKTQGARVQIPESEARTTIPTNSITSTPFNNPLSPSILPSASPSLSAQRPSHNSSTQNKTTFQNEQTTSAPQLSNPRTPSQALLQPNSNSTTVPPPERLSFTLQSNSTFDPHSHLSSPANDSDTSKSRRNSHTNTNHSLESETVSNLDVNQTRSSVLDVNATFDARPIMQRSSSFQNKVTSNESLIRSKPVALEDIFILEINNNIDSFFLIAEFVPDHSGTNSSKFVEYNSEYDKIYKTGKALHFISLSILSIMVLETAVKLFCTGCAFFKKKFEVFDAFIVVSSFALDFVFLDSRWYETGKDATTILVLLLPWRVVRIVNSFLMTMKHKHHIQMMNMKRAKKKAELKSAKLQTLLSEVRKDVQLLVALCRSNEIEEKDITACLYGKGRRSVTLSAMSTCTSLMLISTLGKDAVQEDDIYGKVFKEALNEGDATAMTTEAQQAEEAAIDAAIELDEQLEARRKSRKYKSKKTRVKRSYTVPRRSASMEIPESDINENSSNIFYINDGYLTARGSSPRTSDIIMLGKGPDFTTISGGGAAGCSTVDEEEGDNDLDNDNNETHKGPAPKPPTPSGAAPPPVAARSKYQSKASVRGLPRKGSRSNSMVIYLPEFDDQFEIPIKTPRKKSAVSFDNI